MKTKKSNLKKWLKIVQNLREGTLIFFKFNYSKNEFSFYNKK